MHVCETERQVNGIAKIQWEDVAKVEDFKYLGSTLRSDEECEEKWRREYRQDGMDNIGSDVWQASIS